MLYINNFSKINFNQEKIEKNTKIILKFLSLHDKDLSISFIDDDEMLKLNEKYRGVKHTTDVLSFSQDEGIFNLSNNLGDCIISLEEAKRQSKDENIVLIKKISHLIIHSILHLIGYDHYDAEEELIMREKEQVLLNLIFGKIKQ